MFIIVCLMMAGYKAIVKLPCWDRIPSWMILVLNFEHMCHLAGSRCFYIGTKCFIVFALKLISLG